MPLDKNLRSCLHRNCPFVLSFWLSLWYVLQKRCITYFRLRSFVNPFDIFTTNVSFILSFLFRFPRGASSLIHIPFYVSISILTFTTIFCSLSPYSPFFFYLVTFNYVPVHISLGNSSVKKLTLGYAERKILDFPHAMIFVIIYLCHYAEKITRVVHVFVEFLEISRKDELWLKF